MIFMKERINLITTSKGLKLGIAICVVFVIVGVIFKSIFFSILGVVVGIFLWRLGYILTDVVFNENSVEFVLLNMKRTRYTIEDIAKVENYKDYTFVIKTKDGKTFIGTDSVTLKLLVWNKKKAHDKVMQTDFPLAEYVIH